MGVERAAEAWLAIAVRILLVGTERPLLKALGEDRPPGEAAAVFFGIGALALLPFARPWAITDWGFLRVAAGSGAVYAAAYALYVGALTAGEVSRISPLGSLAGVFVLGLGAWVHGEPLTWTRGAGALAILGGSAALGAPARGAAVDAAPPGGGRCRDGSARRAVWMMVGYAALTAITRMLDKAAAIVVAQPLTYAWTVFTVVAVCQCAALLASGRLAGAARLVARRPLVAVLAGACNGGSFGLLIVALATLPVSVAEPLTTLSLFVSAAIARWWFREPVSTRWLPTAAIVAGTWLLVAEA